jgi:2'-5' RNA ligase
MEYIFPTAYMRIFIALAFPFEFTTLLYTSLQPFKRAIDNVLWTKPDNYHITIQFLGEVKEERVGEIEREIRKTVKDFNPIDLTFNTIGLLGAHNEILKIGVDPSPDILHLYTQVSSHMRLLGFVPDQRLFTPHITIGRVKTPATASVAEELGKEVSFETLRYCASEVMLMQSSLTSAGSRYRIVNRFSL